MKIRQQLLALAVASPLVTLPVAAEEVPVKLPEPKAGQYVHLAPKIEDVQTDPNIKPQLRSVILKGYDLFMNTQQLRGKHVFNDMNCTSCHIGGGGRMWAGPVWPAATTLPDYRGKNNFVNSLEDRITGCFSYSMNGNPPERGSDTMLAIVTYFQWLATGAPVYERNIAGRGYPALPDPELKPDYARGEKVFKANCAICHGDTGAGQKVDGKVVFPPLWGDHSYNWGAGITRIFTAANFIKHNMPLGQPGKLSDQEAWDVAYFINAHERPQDPRYTGDARETRERYLNFHKFTLYGTEVNGKLLGQHDNTGDKPFLKPEALKPRTFEEGSDKL